MKKISIITPCFNTEKYLEETYKTVTNQTYQDWEWILIDDFSTDETLKKLNDFAGRDTRIQVLNNKTNLGAALTRNIGLQNATGDYVAFLDSDDLWHPEKLTRQIQHLRSFNADFTYHNYQTVDASGRKLREFYLASTYKPKNLLRFNPFATSSIMINKRLITQYRINFKEHLRLRQDYLFWYDCLTLSERVVGLPENLSSYRLGNPESLSSNKFKMVLIQWQLYRNEFHLGWLNSIRYILHYGLNGLRKYSNITLKREE